MSFDAVHARIAPALEQAGLPLYAQHIDAMDNAKRFYRYTLVAGVAASHYSGTIEVKPKGSGCVADWRVQFLANNQPDIAVRTRVTTLVKTGLGSLRHRFAAAA